MQRRFAAEIGRRPGDPGYRPQVVYDAIAHWIAQDQLRDAEAFAVIWATCGLFGWWLA